MTTAAISVQGLRRTYGSGAGAFEAVRGIDFEVEQGTITALLGTNGAGKTSSLEVIEGLAKPSAGEVSILGLDPVTDRGAVRQHTGVLLQHSGFSGDLTVRETLEMWAGLVTNPLPVDAAIEMLHLGHRADVRVLALSGGERRRLDLTCTLLGRPKVVFLDEPTTGMDPESRRDVWRLIEGLRDQGTTVLMTTHYLEEAEALAERLLIMSGGQIVRRGTPAEIAEGHPSSISFISPVAVPSIRSARHQEIDGATTQIATDELQTSLTEVLDWANRDGVRLEGLTARPASLEAVFLAIADEHSMNPSTPSTPSADETDSSVDREGALR